MYGDGSIGKTRRKDGRFQGSISVGGRRVYVYGETRAVVRSKLAALRDGRAQNATPAAPQTVAEYLAEWLESIEPRVRPKTFRGYRQIVTLHAIPALGSNQLAELSPDDLDRFYRGRLRAGLSPRYVAQMHRVLHHALKQAQRRRLARENVADLVDPPRVERYDAQTLSVAQARRLLETLSGDRLAAYYLLALRTGMRQGEMLALKWDAVDLATGQLTVRLTLHPEPPRSWRLAETKTYRSRRPLALPASVTAALRRWQLAQHAERQAAGKSWTDHGFVFTQADGDPLSSYTERRRFYKLLAAAGLPRVRPHDLRHTFSTVALEGGAPLSAVSSALGHSLPSTTLNIYTHATQSGDARLAEAIDAIFDRDTPPTDEAQPG